MTIEKKLEFSVHKLIMKQRFAKNARPITFNKLLAIYINKKEIQIDRKYRFQNNSKILLNFLFLTNKDNL